MIASPELAVACEDTSTVSPAFLRRVKLKNYKSIAACDVELSSLTFLVGPNGAGKSNFLDALRLVTDALSVTSITRSASAVASTRFVAARGVIRTTSV